MRFWQRRSCPSERAHIPFLLTQCWDGCVLSAHLPKSAQQCRGAGLCWEQQLPAEPLPLQCPVLVLQEVARCVPVSLGRWELCLHVWHGWNHSLEMKPVCSPVLHIPLQHGSAELPAAPFPVLAASPWVHPVSECWPPHLLLLLAPKPFQAAPLCLRF